MSGLGKKVCEALGLDPNTIKDITINIRPHKPPEVTITHLVHDQSLFGKNFSELLLAYELHLK